MGWEDFARIVETEGKSYTPYAPEGAPADLTGSYRPLGLPRDPISNYAIPGLESTVSAETPTPSVFSGIQNIFDGFTMDSASFFSGVKQTIRKGYDEVKGAAGTVYDDVTAPVTNALTSTFWYAILGVVAIGGLLYVAGKSGAFKAVGR